jgi:acyl-coenzyme A synthetase/AMP-(fatty) acid ligase
MRAAGEEAIAPIRGKLRVISSGGEPLNPELNRWAAAALGRHIHEAYGQTEMGVNVLNHHDIRHEARVGSVGLPSPGMALAVLDDDLNEVPARQDRRARYRRSNRQNTSPAALPVSEAAWIMLKAVTPSGPTPHSSPSR